MNNFTAANTSLINVSLKAVSETQDELNALCCLKPSAFCCVFPFVSKGQFEDENLVFNVYSAHRNTCDMLFFTIFCKPTVLILFKVYPNPVVRLLTRAFCYQIPHQQGKIPAAASGSPSTSQHVSFSVTSCRKYGVWHLTLRPSSLSFKLVCEFEQIHLQLSHSQESTRPSC